MEEPAATRRPHSTDTQEYPLLSYRSENEAIARKVHYEEATPYSIRPLHEDGAHVQGDAASQSTSAPKNNYTLVRVIPEISLKGATILQWKYQLIGAIMAFGSFAALVATAARYDGKPSSDWSSKWLSINAVVAGLTTLIRLNLLAIVTSCIMEQRWAWFSQPRSPAIGHPLKDFEAIDSASRGPLGSFEWLLRHPLSLSVVNLAALWTLFAVAFDVFSQQAVRVENRMAANATAKAYLPWARNVTHTVDQAWLAAMYDGIFNSEIDDLSATCPTGNCSWDPVPSIGVCGGCWRMNISWEDIPDMRSCSNDSQPICNYTGFSGTILEGVRLPNTTIDVGQEYTIQDSISIRARLGRENEYINRYVPYLAKTNWFPLTIEVLQLSYTLHEGKITFSSPNITECAFWYCMQSLSVNVSSGIQRQTLRTGSQAYTPMNNSFVLENTAPTGNAAADFFNSTMMFNDTEYSDMHKHIFSVSNTSFAGSTYNTVTENGYFGFSANDFVRLPKPLTQSWEDAATNRAAWISRVAKSLSNLVRQQNAVSIDEDSYSGTAYSTTTHIRIVWPWMVYPACMLVGALFVLAATIITWKQSQRDVVGNGSVELILAELEFDAKSHSQQRYSSSEGLVRDTGENVVQLEKRNHKWVFRDV